MSIKERVLFRERERSRKFQTLGAKERRNVRMRAASFL